MKTRLRQAVEKMRQSHIRKLIDAGIYKISDHHLYELTLTELEKEVQRLNR